MPIKLIEIEIGEFRPNMSVKDDLTAVILSRVHFEGLLRFIRFYNWNNDNSNTLVVINLSFIENVWSPAHARCLT